MERAVNAHFVFAFNTSPITILAIQKFREVTYSIQALTALSLPCFSNHMFRKVSETAPTFCFEGTENILLVPSTFYLHLASRSFPTSQHLSSAHLTVQLSTFCLLPLFFHYLFISCGPVILLLFILCIMWRLCHLGFILALYKVQRHS